MEIEAGQTWEMYSRPEGRWVRVIVAKVEDAGVLLRYEGLLEFLTVELEDMLTKPEVFRPVSLPPASAGRLPHLHRIGPIA